MYYYRGLWGRFNVFQDWQYNALLRYGVKPDHDFLDIGCGCLRLGMKLIPYLENDRYCGIDPVQGYIDLGRLYMSEVVRTDKRYRLACSADFAFDDFNRAFDFAMAHSVFTHMSFAQIEDV